jgi:hypothetical protein
MYLSRATTAQQQIMKAQLWQRFVAFGATLHQAWGTFESSAYPQIIYVHLYFNLDYQLPLAGSLHIGQDGCL